MGLSIDAIEFLFPKGSARRETVRAAAFRLGFLDLIRKFRNPSGWSRDEQYQTWLRWNQFRPARPQLKKGPLLSIIVVGANPEATLESLAKQTYDNWEAIVSARVAPRLSKPLPPKRLVVIQPRELGSLQQCLSALAGDYFIVMRGADRLDDEALQRTAEFILTNPSVDVVYTDSDQIDRDGGRFQPFFKPSWSPRFIQDMNYVGLSCFFRTTLAHAVGGFRGNEPWTAVYDLLLRAVEKTRKVGHIARPLYSISGQHGYYPRKRATPAGVQGTPLVTIITSTRDRHDLISNCIQSVELRSTYKNLEIIVVDHNSRDRRTRQYLSSISHRVIRYEGPFNFARINNYAAREARGDFLVFLNNDVEVLEPNWMQNMLLEAQREDVGMVGALLLYPNGSIQHCGIVLGVGPVCGHLFRYLNPRDENYWSLHTVTRECAAVTAACAMIRKDVFLEIGGFDEHLIVDFADVDLCLRLREHGYVTVVTPSARMVHRESSTRGFRQRLPTDESFFTTRWQDYLGEGDPFYNNNLTMRWENCAVGPFGHDSAALALLLELYAMRKDLLIRFPEAKDGVRLQRLAQWAITEGVKDKQAAPYILPRLQTYQNYLRLKENPLQLEGA